MEKLWESTEEVDHLSPHLPLSVPALCTPPNRDRSTQMDLALNFSKALMWLQEVTWDKAKLKKELASKLEELNKSHEDQWSSMAEWMDATFKEVLSHMGQADLVRLLPCFLSTVASPCIGPRHPVNKAFTSIMPTGMAATTGSSTMESEDTTTQASPSSLACWASTLSPVLNVFGILAVSTLINHSLFALALGLRSMKRTTLLMAQLGVKAIRGLRLVLRRAVFTVAMTHHHSIQKPVTMPINHSLQIFCSVQPGL